MMKILALETTERTPTLAAAEGATPLASFTCDAALRSAQSLVPGIRQLLDDVRWLPREVDLVAVSVGPGSFTGLRVGVTSAKVFAYAVDAQVLGIGTLEALAAAAPADVTEFWAAVDAQRGQWVVQRFARSGQPWPQPEGAAQLVEADSWLAGLPLGSRLTGPVLHKPTLRLPDRVCPLPAGVWTPSAREIAVLAARDYAAGRRDDLWTLAPRYSRPSAAEEKLQS